MPDLFPATLIGWCTLWAIACGITLIRSRIDTPRRTAFWGMTMLWIGIDLGILAWAAVAPVEDPQQFRNLLLVNGGLDVVYIAVGLILLLRRGDLPRGFGMAILIQGGFLLLLDFGWWLALSGI